MSHALVCDKPGELSFHVTQKPKPVPGPKDLLVKVHNIALNPIDWKVVKYGIFVNQWPAVLGCDYSGTVEAVGAEVKHFKAGDAVWGFKDFIAVKEGCFQEYVTAPEEFTGKKPSNISFEQAATLGVGALTAFLSVVMSQGFTLPLKNQAHGKFLLVWGGATSVGAIAIQIGKLLGFHVIATCSAATAEYVKSLGAEFIVDYRDPEALTKIRAIGMDNLNHAVDTVSAETAQLCVDALSPLHPGIVSTIAGAPKNNRDNVKVAQVILLNATISAEYGPFVKQAIAELGARLESKEIVPNKVQKQEGGLSGIEAGLKLMVENKVSAAKLVVSL